jgi:hypothetical protein
MVGDMKDIGSWYLAETLVGQVQFSQEATLLSWDVAEERLLPVMVMQIALPYQRAPGV